MKIWVDADACPVKIKELLYRIAKRTKIRVTLVANQVLRIPKSPFIKSLTVGPGFDIADNEILRLMAPGDLVITNDIPLAALILEKKGAAVNFRGGFYTDEEIRSCLYVRDIKETLRSSGIETGGPRPMSQKDCQNFSNALDRYLQRMG
ncbi:MAG: YaiI/YqxD family protein [Desulfobacterales bacterium]|nr:YaiI/YqxD family protein [Desulfobacterales bacterium]